MKAPGFFLPKDMLLELFPETLGKPGKIRQFLNVFVFCDHVPKCKAGCIDTSDIIEFKVVKNLDQQFGRKFSNPPLPQSLP